MNTRLCSKVLSPLLLVVVLGASAADTETRRHRETRHVMGTLLSITLYHRDSREARNLLDQAFQIAQRLDAALSNYKADSEVSQFNAQAGEPVVISATLQEFLSVSKELSRRSDGAFDVTVGPLVNLWRHARRSGRHPPESVIRERRNLVGHSRLTVNENGTAELAFKGMRVETGGLGKGFAVDRIARFLRKNKVERALINFGRSSVLALGPPPGETSWRLLVQFPDEAPLGIIELKETAFSASDSFARSFELAGSTYGHIIDPQTARPLRQRRRALVLTRNATEAEVLSKYLLLRECHDPCTLTAWGRPTVAILWEDAKPKQWRVYPREHAVEFGLSK